MLKNGYKATTVASQIQQKVKAALENMLELNVKEVNVNILGIQREKTE